MREDPYLQELREALVRYGQKPAREQINDLIRSGITDEQGNVLVRMPVPPGTEDEPDAAEEQPGPAN